MSPPGDDPLSRRDFLKRSGAAGLAFGNAAGQREGAIRGDSRRRSKVIDCHAHLQHRSRMSWDMDDRKLIAAADRLGIDELCCSVLTPRRPATAEGFRECNRWVRDGIRRFPDRVLGYCYVNPGCKTEALEEIKRCVMERGFIGVKLYNEHTCTDPIVFPVVELAIELGVPILHHAGHMHYPVDDQPHISDGGHLAELGRRYPEAKLICGHICGGGDWQWTIKALRHAPTVLLDTSGSVADEGVMELAIEVLGVDRLVFGCDMSMTAGMGRIRAANLGEAEKERILGGTMEKILGSRKR
jgi:predicted TIM-barrel fold metal-dependent hydrolase